MDITKKKILIAQNASFRAMGDEGVILRTDNGQLYSTNSTGTDFFEQILKGASTSDAITALVDIYDVSADVLAKDLAEMVVELEAEGVLVVEDA
ncbi:MAG: PqqD family protein [Pseudomonadota bacterium]